MGNEQVKHSPGPWTYTLGNYGARTPTFGYSVKSESRDMPVSSAGVYVRGTLHDYTPEELEANARLIAAAPELYEALRDLVANLTEGDFISTTRIDKAVSALAKANQV